MILAGAIALGITVWLILAEPMRRRHGQLARDGVTFTGKLAERMTGR